MKRYYVTVNGKRYEVEVEEVKGEFQGKPAEAPAASSTQVQNASQPAAPAPAASIEVAPAEEASKAKQTVDSSSVEGERIECPMPGTIVGVSVKKGDTVKKGDVMFVLEAMKMENEIMASRDCKMLSVNVSKGDAVNTGEILGIIE